MNQQAFAKLGPVVKSLTTIDTASITPPGMVVLDQCVVKLIFCQTQAKATIAAAPTLSASTWPSPATPAPPRPTSPSTR